MNKTLVLSETQSKALLDFYINKISELNGIIATYMSERAEFEDLVNQLQGSKPKQNSTSATVPVVGSLFSGAPSDYDPSWSIPRKALFILNKEHTLLRTTEIFDKLSALEPSLIERRKDVMVLLSSGLADKIGKAVYREGNNRMDYKYGLSEWKKEEAA